MSQRFAVVHEAEADFRTATELADRVLVHAIGWLDEELLPLQREWVGTVPVERRLTWKTIPQIAREIGIKAHGHFDGKPGEADAASARRAILYLREAIADLKAILLIRDRDDQPERQAGLEQARAQLHRNAKGEVITIVVGLANIEREAWVISGFEPQDEAETTRLKTERMRLGFQPHERSHELTAGKDDTAIRSPKRVLRELSGDSFHRERQCWAKTPLALLRERGVENGLAAYLQEVQDRLAPLIGHVAEG